RHQQPDSHECKIVFVQCGWCQRRRRPFDRLRAGFYPVSDDSWQEETVTWNNAPTADTTLLGSLGDVNPDTWYEVNLTSLITADGTYNLRISDRVKL
ncbi:MAG TPA: DNRLRE domain-containing protein, partial [Anaerolineales bacterium]|nr:DNRLRE domain-containing protein [Anaerolineales bacterium]